MNFFGVQSVDTVGRCTTSSLLVGPAWLWCLVKEPNKKLLMKPVYLSYNHMLRSLQLITSKQMFKIMTVSHTHSPLRANACIFNTCCITICNHQYMVKTIITLFFLSFMVILLAEMKKMNNAQTQLYIFIYIEEKHINWNPKLVVLKKFIQVKKNIYMKLKS